MLSQPINSSIHLIIHQKVHTRVRSCISHSETCLSKIYDWPQDPDTNVKDEHVIWLVKWHQVKSVNMKKLCYKQTQPSA